MLLSHPMHNHPPGFWSPGVSSPSPFQLFPSAFTLESLFLEVLHQHHPIVMFKVKFFSANCQLLPSLFLLMASPSCHLPTLHPCWCTLLQVAKNAYSGVTATSITTRMENTSVIPEILLVPLGGQTLSLEPGHSWFVFCHYHFAFSRLSSEWNRTVSTLWSVSCDFA